MATAGRPKGTKKYNDAETLRENVEKYISQCESKGTFPDEAGMRIFLKISKRTQEAYVSENENPEHWKEFREVFEYAKDKRESFLVRRMTTDNKLAQGCLNALKQPANGGYIDRPAENGERTVKVIFDKNITEDDFK